MAGADVPFYESSLRVPEGPQQTIQVVNPPVPDMSGIGAAAAQFGQAGAHFAAKLAAGKAATDDAKIKSDYLTSVDDLRQTYAESTDFKTAPDEFASKLKEKQDALLGGIMDPKRREEMRLFMTVHGLSAAKEVNNKQLSNEADFNVAALNDRSATYVRDAATAGSPAERQTIVDSWNADVEKQAAAGWISRVDAVKRKVVGAQTLDDAAAMSLIRINPRQAAIELQDPEKFKSLGPIQRQTLINQAQAQSDQVVVAGIQNIATRDPARAVATVGLVGRPEEADAVFARGIMPIENASGDNTLESKAGAVGKTQIMPGTARDVARYLGLKVFDGLDDAAVKQKLKDDAVLNVTLGKTHWQGLLARYDGRIYVAAAAYNAGPGNADKPRADAWLREATQKFGPNFTAAELASVIPIAETRDYVLKLAKKLGAPDDGGGLSPQAQFHAAASVRAVIAQQESERVGAIKAIAAVGRETDDPATLFKAGYNEDPAKYAAWKQTQMLAAQAGDMTAAKAVREAEFQREMLPFRQKALRTPPSQLENLVGSETARLHGLPDVSVDAKNRLDVARETLKSVKAARDENVIGLAEQAQLVPAGQRVAIDPAANPGAQDFRMALALRGAQANSAAAFYQGKAVALKPQEASALKERWANAGPDERFQLLEAFGQTLSGNAYRETLKAVAGDSDIMATIGRIAADRPALAREILRGNELLKSKGVSEKVDLVKSAFSAKLGGQLYPDPAQQKAVEDAAVRLYVARAGGDGTLYDVTDSAGIERAIEDIAGPIVKRNGVKLPVTPGIDPARFIGALDNLSQADLNLMGGAQDRNGTPLLPAEIASHAVLKPLAPGSSHYVVGMRDAKSPDGFAPLFTASEMPTPLVFDMRVLAANHGPGLGFVPGQMNRANARFRAGQAERIRQTLDQVRAEDAAR